MKPGSLISNFPTGIDCETISALVLEVWDFKKYCDMHDDLMLTYDVDEAWEHWQRCGPLLVVLDPVSCKPRKIWARQQS